MPIKLCTVTGCREKAGPRGKCPDHMREYERERSRRRRKATGGIFKTAMWQHRRRQAFQRAGGICQCEGCPACVRVYSTGPGCERIATDVDHVVPLDRGGAPYDASNHQALCSGCHRDKTARENSRCLRRR
jgi:5-methylcytosine-specific restriction enzyme A